MPSLTSSLLKTTSIRKTILRWSLRITGALMLILIALLILFVIINRHDEALSPQVSALLQEPVYRVADQKNGFFVLRAMDAGASLDAFHTGHEIVQADQARYGANPALFDKSPIPDNYLKAPKSSWDSQRCGKKLRDCSQTDLHNRAQLQASLDANAVLLQRYQRMQEMGDFEEHFITSPTQPVPAYFALVQASDMMMVKAAFQIADADLKAGVESLQKNDRYLRLLLRKSASLISRMVVLAMLRKQTRNISELVELYPRLVEQFGAELSDIVRPMNQSERDLSTVFFNEARLSLALFQRLGSQDVFPEESSDLVKNFQSKFGGLFYQPNASSNQAGEFWTEMIAAAKLPASSYSVTQKQLLARVDQRLEDQKFSYLGYVYNPIGKVLLQFNFTEIYFPYLERSADVDGYLRLAGLQLDLRRKKIADAAIAGHVSHAPSAFRSPYDDTAMIWNASERQLQFSGRERANSNVDGGKLFIAVLR